MGLPLFQTVEENRPGSPSGRLKPYDTLVALMLFYMFAGIYLINGDVPYNPDVYGHAELASRLWRDGNLELSPVETPNNFPWFLRSQGVETEVLIEAWDDELVRLRESGDLFTRSYIYFVTPTVLPGIYVNLFGPGVPVISSPIFEFWDFWVRPLTLHPADLWTVGKAIASISVALSGVFIYLTCRLYAPIYSALAITLAYALGTAVWSVSSQNLWQHSFLELFLAAGTFFYCLDRRWSSPILTSICYAAAVCCRPTTAMFVVAAALDYLLRDRVRWVLFTLAGVPIGLAFLYYNHRYFGSPFVFGQTPTDHPEVIAIGGPGNVWKTPFWYGLSAHLFLPARGLLFYSPFLLFSFWGAIRSWKMPQFRLIRYLIFGVLFIFLVQSFFVDWWSGFSYMYRHTVDTVPALAVFLLPVFQDWGRRLWWKCTFGFFVAYAFAMQLVGVTIYDVTGWNARLGTVAVLPHASPEYRVGVDRLGDQLVQHQDLFVVPMNIDRKQFRHRLWSLQDHQIRYYLSHPDEARRRREDWFRQMMRSREERLADTHTRVGDAYRLLGDRIRADKHYRRALQVNPHHGPAQMGQLLAFHPIHEAPLRSLVDQCRLSPDEKPYRLIEEGLQLLPVYPIDGFGLLEEAIRREPVLTLEVLASYLFVPAAGHLLENNDQAPDLAAVRGRNRAILWTVAAWQEIHRRDAERATEFLQQATLADPTLPWAPWRLGQILLARGEFARAIPPLESALRLGLRGAEEASAWDGLGQAKEKLNDPAGADQCRRRAEQIDPRGNARAWYRMQQVEMIPDP